MDLRNVASVIIITVKLLLQTGAEVLMNIKVAGTSFQLFHALNFDTKEQKGKPMP